MKTVIVTEFGGADVLKLAEAPEPVAGAGEVVVSVDAAGVGFVDVMAAAGQYPLFTAPGFVPGFEVAGTVLSTGPGVSAEWVGRRVFATLDGGGYAEKAVVQEKSLVELPDELSGAQAVALGINALVAHFGIARGTIKRGDSVLVRGAGGGIGIMATQIVAQLSDDVTVVTSSNERGRRLKELGASNVLDRRSGTAIEYGEYDVIVDTVGGEELGAFIGRLKPNGRYVLVGGAGGIPPADFGVSFLHNYHKSISFFPFSLYATPFDERGRAAKVLFDQALKRGLVPVIDETFALADAAQAHRRLESGSSFGKIILAN
jgi:NADPH:quinone reductase